MDTLTHLILQTACRSTHHKLAVDALWQIRHPQATSWRNLFLTQYRAYLRGAKAPDDEFQDFRNHVLHIDENNWGGAVPTAQYWYDQTVTSLRSEDWTTAAFNAGVLSHYYSDPHMPLHTGQSAAETVMHRAAEWSVTQSYDQLRGIIHDSGAWPHVDVPHGKEWLGQMVIAGARLAHPHYETLVREYDMARGVLDPARGWNDRCRRILAELLAHTIVGFARILERAIDEANVSPPDTSPALEVFLATANQPIRTVLHKIADVRERAQIEAMFHELQTTGTIEEHLPEEQRVIRREVAAYRAQQPKLTSSMATRRATPTLSNTKSAAKVISAKVVATQVAATKTIPATSIETVEKAKPNVTDRSIPVAKSIEAAIATTETQLAAPLVAETPKRMPERESKANAPLAPPLESKPELKVAPSSSATAAATDKTAPLTEKSAKYRLELSDLLERAPSIGPKTANRMLGHGWRTVADFLAADPAEVSKKLNSSWAPAATIADWQKQAWLVLQIADLSGTGAQLLVGAGYSTIEEVAAAEAAEMIGYVTEFAESSLGQKALCEAKIPDQVTIARWIAAARNARPVVLQKKSA